MSTDDYDDARQQEQARDSGATWDQIGDSPRTDASSKRAPHETGTLSFGLITMNNACANAYPAAAGAHVREQRESRLLQTLDGEGAAE